MLMKKKEKKKLTWKQVIVLIIITIVLGIICYFIATEITKSIIDHRTMEEKLKNEDYSDLIRPDTIDNITLDDLISNYNKISEDIIDLNNITDHKITIDDIEIEFYLKDDNNINIIGINFNNKNKVKKVISNMIIANNEKINKKTTDLIYNRVFETLGNTEDNNSKTSEFFQYQGLEFSLKEYKDNNYKYSFRIGRIVKDNQETDDSSNEEE